jgi:hypothetical protein
MAGISAQEELRLRKGEECKTIELSAEETVWVIVEVRESSFIGEAVVNKLRI